MNPQEESGNGSERKNMGRYMLKRKEDICAKEKDFKANCRRNNSVYHYVVRGSTFTRALQLFLS